MSKKFILIFAGGEKDLSKDEFQGALSEHNINSESALSIIAADSGGDFAVSCGVTPDLLIGDLDSISHENLESLSNNQKTIIEKHNQDKLETDLELALNKAISHSPESIFIFGAFGGRLDHELANISLCADGDYEGSRIVLIGKDQCGYVLQNESSVTISGELGQVFSLIPLSDEVSGVSILGSRWELKDVVLKSGKSRSVCNEFLGGDVVVSVGVGKVFVIVSGRNA